MGVKTTAELLEQEDAVASAAGTTRAPPAVRRPIAESSYVLRAGLPQARRRPPPAITGGAGFDCTHTMSRMDCAEGIYQRPERSPQQSITPCRQAASVGNAPHVSVYVKRWTKANGLDSWNERRSSRQLNAQKFRL